MASSNGNIFRVTGHLCGEFAGPGDFPAHRPERRSFDVFVICAWINGWVNNREAADLRRNRAHYDVTGGLVSPSNLFHYAHLTSGQCQRASVQNETIRSQLSW